MSNRQETTKGKWLRKPESTAAVIFIHGILSDGDACWRSDEAYWPDLVIADPNLKHLGVYLFSYQSDIFSSGYNLGDAVEALHSYFDLDDLYGLSSVTFVCHSMGGIVARRFIFTRQMLLARARLKLGLFLVASPSLGSEYARFFELLANIFGNSQVEALRFSENNSWLNDLDRNFINLKEEGTLVIEGQELVENEFIIFPKFFNSRIVPPFSGARYFADSVKIPHTDHFSIAKPVSAESLQHRLLIRFLRKSASFHREEQQIDKAESPRESTSDPTIGTHFLEPRFTPGDSPGKPLHERPPNLKVEIQQSDRLQGSNTVHVFISQHFRIADVLTHPQIVRTRGFGEIVHNSAKIRRALNQNKVFRLGKLGVLRPVVTIADKFDDFWKHGVPDFRTASAQQLWFLPFEVDLTSYLATVDCDVYSILGNILEAENESIANRQVTYRLRIYPPGVGVVRIGIVLKFRETIHVTAVSKIAQELESAFFVQTTGEHTAFQDVLTGIIDEVSESLFLEQRITGAARRWRPPEICYYIHGDETFQPKFNTLALANLMRLVPETRETLDSSKMRIEAVLKTSFWTRDRVLAVSGDKVTLCHAQLGSTMTSKQRHNSLKRSLTETIEVISAAAYSETALVDEIVAISATRALHDKVYADVEAGVQSVAQVIAMLRMLLIAIISAKANIKRCGMQVLTTLAEDMWVSRHPQEHRDLIKSLTYIEKWCDGDPTTNLDQRAIIRNDISEIFALLRAFKSSTTGNNAGFRYFWLQHALDTAFAGAVCDQNRSGFINSSIDTIL